jgi:hypothetical protein
MFVPQGPTDAIINEHRRGLPPQSSEHENSLLSSFSSSILHNPLVALLGLIFVPQNRSLA